VIIDLQSIAVEAFHRGRIEDDSGMIESTHSRKIWLSASRLGILCGKVRPQAHL
jgi:hypothetical protein